MIDALNSVGEKMNMVLLEFHRGNYLENEKQHSQARGFFDRGRWGGDLCSARLFRGAAEGSGGW